MTDAFAHWRHVFKLDPDKELSDEALERICLSGTDAVVVGGSTGVTFDNTVDLLARIRRYEVSCALEISSREAIVPGFDLYFVPVALNAQDAEWIVGQHHQALKEYGPLLDWTRVAAEGYIIMNADSAVARLTSANTQLDDKDAEAYARLAEQLFSMPIVYLEYSGTFGDMERVSRIRGLLRKARLFYGGGIDSRDKARQAAACADTIVVGNALYERLDDALDTVEAVKSAGS